MPIFSAGTTSPLSRRPAISPEAWKSLTSASPRKPFIPGILPRLIGTSPFRPIPPRWSISPPAPPSGPRTRGETKMWIEKHSHILDFTLSSLARRKGKNLALIAVYVLTVSLLGSVMFYSAAMKREAALLLKDTPEIVVQRTVAGRHDLMPVTS